VRVLRVFEEEMRWANVAQSLRLQDRPTRNDLTLTADNPHFVSSTLRRLIALWWSIFSSRPAAGKDAIAKPCTCIISLVPEFDVRALCHVYAIWIVSICILWSESKAFGSVRAISEILLDKSLALHVTYLLQLLVPHSPALSTAHC